MPRRTLPGGTAAVADRVGLTYSTQPVPDSSDVSSSSGASRRRVRARLPAPGERIGGEDRQRFEMLDKLGSGGMGVVMLAKDHLLDRQVAIKFVTIDNQRMSNDESLARFHLEARACARLNHENVVRIFDFGTHEGVPFLVMEHLIGESLSARLVRGRLEMKEAIHLMEGVTRGLDHAHKAGIVHRDLKPGNIFISRDGRAHILDFGVAAFVREPRKRSGGRQAGTPQYMAPEQWTGEILDSRADLWAVGVLFFEMITGKTPFDGPTMKELKERVLNPSDRPSLRALRPELPEAAENLVNRTLCRDPAERVGTAEELLDLLVGLELSLEGGEERRRPRAERRLATLLSCSLVDLMVLGEQLGPDAFGALLERFFTLGSTAVRQLGGTVVSSLGGRMVASFGWPEAHEDDVGRALRAAFLIMEAMQGVLGPDGSAHAVRIGVHSDMVTAGVMGSGMDAHPLLLGAAPHVAVAIEESAMPGQIRISTRILSVARGIVQVEPLGMVSLVGHPRPIEAWVATGLRDSASRFDQRSSQRLIPLVAREPEMEELRWCWESAVSGTAQVVMLRGEAGIGKSRLVASLEDVAGRGPAIRVSCQCWSQYRNTALYPLLEGIMRVMGVHPQDVAAEKVRKMMEALVRIGLSPGDHLPAIAAYRSLPLEGRYPPVNLSPDLLKAKVLASILAIIQAAAAQLPLLLVVEDLHWADASTLEVLEQLILLASDQSCSLMLLCTFRPEFRPPWAIRAPVRQLHLGRLSASEAGALLSLVNPGRPLSAAVMDRLIRRADGVPLFLEEIARMVGEQGDLVDSIPATLQEFLSARLGRLGTEGRWVAGLAAVLGREFSYPMIAAVPRTEAEFLRRGLRQLVETGLLIPQHAGEEPRYQFRHAMIHEAALGSLLQDQRQRHHQGVATMLETSYPEVVEQQPELLAHHYAEAGEGSKAIAYYEKASQRAVQRSANVDAIAHYARALELLAQQPESLERDRRELSLRLPMGAPLMAIRGYANPEVHANAVRARELCLKAGDDAQLFPAVLGLWQFYMVGGEAEVSAGLGRQLHAMATRSGDTVMRMLAHRALGTSLMLLGDMAACRDHCREGLALYDRNLHGGLALRYGQDPGVTCGLYLAWCLWFLGEPDSAVRAAEDALRLARSLDHPLSVAFALNYLAAVHNYRGEYRLAAHLAAEALELATTHRLALWVAMSHIQGGWSLIGLGDRTGGAEELTEGVDGWKRTGAKAGLTFFFAALIGGLLKAGRIEQARTTMAEMERFIEEKGERFFESELLRLRGEEVLVRDPNAVVEAESWFRRGLAVAQAQQALAWQLRNATSLARVLKRHGQSSEADGLLRAILVGFREGLQTADLAEARRVLG